MATHHPLTAAPPKGATTSLPHGVAPLDSAVGVADRCRALLLSLMNGSAHGLGRRELIDWLARYHALAAWVEGPPRPVDSLRRRSPVAHAHVQEWIQEATREVDAAVAVLRDPWRGRGFALDATLDVWIVPFIDDGGRRGWRPTDRRHRTLAERAQALLAADYLVRPADYERKLEHCGVCHRIWFLDRDPVHGKRPPTCCRIKAPRANTHVTWSRGALRPAAQQTA